MSEVKTAPIKYIFLDIVAFTRNRSVEAQSDLVDKLNAIVSKTLTDADVSEDKRIFLPTGDGICIAMINIADPYDIHLQIALSILEKISIHNSGTKEKMRQFDVRIGLNENVDNFVTDINGRSNIAGMGINMAQRIMGFADGGQILVGQTVYEMLQGREKYMSSFRNFSATGKHGTAFNVYQYIKSDRQGLNTEIPEAFVTPQKFKPRLTRLAAYYIAYAIKNESFFLTKKDAGGFGPSAAILLYFLADDSREQVETSQYETPTRRVWGAKTASLEEQYQYYDKIDFWIVAELSKQVTEKHLGVYSECFTGPLFGPGYYVFVSDKGRERLKQQWPDIWGEFSL